MYSSAPENMMDRYGKSGTEAEEVYAPDEQV